MAGEEIGALFVRIGTDLSGLKTGLTQGEKDVANFTSRVNSGLLKGAAVIAAIGVTLGAFAIGAYMKVEELGQAAYDMGEKFGMSGGNASKWLAIAAQLGLSSQSVGTGFKFLSKNMGDIALALKNHQKPTKALVESFKELGVNIFTTHGRLKDTNTVMALLADKFSKMPDGAAKTAAAVKIFGRSGADLIPLLNQGAAGLKKMTAEGVALGTVLSTKQVEAAHKAYLAHKQFDQALSGLVNRIGIDVLPIAATFFNLVVTKGVPAIEDFGKKIQSVGPDLQMAFNVLKALAPYLIVIGGAWAAWNVALAVTKIIQMGILAVQFAAGIVAIVSKVGLWTAAQWLLNVALDANPIGLVIIVIAALAAGIIYAYTHSKTFRDVVNALWGAIKLFAATFWSDVKPIFDWFIPVLQHAWDLLGKVANALGSAFGGGSSGAGNNRAGAGKLGHYAMGGMVPGPIGAPSLAVVHGGERVLTPGQQRNGSGNSPEVASLLTAILNELRSVPGGQTGVEAALYKAVHLSGVNRNRGMAGA